MGSRDTLCGYSRHCTGRLSFDQRATRFANWTSSRRLQIAFPRQGPLLLALAQRVANHSPPSPSTFSVVRTREVHRTRRRLTGCYDVTFRVPCDGGHQLHRTSAHRSCGFPVMVCPQVHEQRASQSTQLALSHVTLKRFPWCRSTPSMTCALCIYQNPTESDDVERWSCSDARS